MVISHTDLKRIRSATGKYGPECIDSLIRDLCETALKHQDDFIEEIRRSRMRYELSLKNVMEIVGNEIREELSAIRSASNLGLISGDPSDIIDRLAKTAEAIIEERWIGDEQNGEVSKRRHCDDIETPTTALHSILEQLNKTKNVDEVESDQEVPQ